jgi:hypothetical protein
MCDSGLKSCYQPDSDASCCGCANWWSDGANVPPPPATDSCLHQNNYWSNSIKPGLLWLKKACPTAYTYPYGISDQERSHVMNTTATNLSSLVGLDCAIINNR